MNTPHSEQPSSQNLSHEQRASSFEAAKQALIDNVKKRGDLLYVSVEEQLQYIEQASQFEFGRFLIQRAGLNGYWTHYVYSHPKRDSADLNPLEDFFLNRSPMSLATQQRHAIFKNEIQKHLTEGCKLASIPSGLMGEFLDLDFSKISNFTLHGIDLDPETLAQAADYAKEKGLKQHCIFSQSDAWDLKMDGQFDLIASNGLNVYVEDEQKVIELYREFHKALKPQGILITSFLTPPPLPGYEPEWNFEEVNLEDAMLQKILMVDILSAKWQVFRSEETAKAQLKAAGFSDIQVIYDKAHIFPTLIAHKK